MDATRDAQRLLTDTKSTQEAHMLEWIEQESWSAFVEMRRRIKAPLTQYAEKLIVRELVKLKSAGHDPQSCLDQSIRNSWRDVFPVRDKGFGDARVPEVWKPEPELSTEQKAAADQARRRVMSAVRVVR